VNLYFVGARAPSFSQFKKREQNPLTYFREREKKRTTRKSENACTFLTQE
jgi:hypothetical protein